MGIGGYDDAVWSGEGIQSLVTAFSTAKISLSAELGGMWILALFK